MGIIVDLETIIVLCFVGAILCGVLLYFLIRPFYRLYKWKIKGLKLYRSETILSSGGIAESLDWFKNDREAAKKLCRRDFIYRVYPGKEERVKP